MSSASSESIVALIREQEQRVFTIAQPLLFGKRAKCPVCRINVYLNHRGKDSKKNFFCTNCYIMFAN